MSSPQTETATTEQGQVPEMTVFSRVASIPLISSSLVTINDALTSNAVTRFPYAQAKGLSSTAYKLTEPLQVKLAGLIVHVDDMANKAVDLVQARYPYPFTAQPGDVLTYVRERKDNTISGVTEALDSRVTTPARNVAQGIDHRLTPIVDYLENAVSRLNYTEPSPCDAKYQYQRAYALSINLKDNVVVYSHEQLKHLQAQFALAQKASETAHAISSLASSSLATANTKIHTLSDNMLSELQKLQGSVTQLRASFQSTFHDSASHFQQSYADLSGALASTVHNLTDIIKQSDLPIQDKIACVGKEVQNRVHPLLDSVKKSVSEALARSKEAISPTNETNGHGPSKSEQQ